MRLGAQGDDLTCQDSHCDHVVPAEEVLHTDPSLAPERLEAAYCPVAHRTDPVAGQEGFEADSIRPISTHHAAAGVDEVIHCIADGGEGQNRPSHP